MPRDVYKRQVIHNAPDYDLTARMDFVMGEVIKPLLQTEE